jgi:hypothetical protein
MSITDFTEKIKDRLVILFWPLFFGQLTLISTFLGLIIYLTLSSPAVTIAQSGPQNEPPAGFVGDRKGGNGSIPLQSDNTTKNIDSQGKETQIVASKNGTRYYLPHCSGINRIKIANRVYFASVSLAEKAGYTKAKNCH